MDNLQNAFGGAKERLFQLHPIRISDQITISPSILQAGIIVLLLFFLVLTLAQLRHRYLSWHVKGIIPGIAFGFMLALLVEGIFFAGGKSLLARILGWKDPPKPIANVLDVGREKLTEVLGEETGVNEVSAQKTWSSEMVLEKYELLETEEKTRFTQFLCKQ